MLKLKNEGLPDGPSRTRVAPGAPSPAQNVLARRFAEAMNPAGQARPARPGLWGKVASYLGLPLLVAGAVAWANSAWHFLPLGSSGLPAEYRIPNSGETVVIDCRITPCPSPVGKGRFTVTALAGVRRASENDRLIRDTKGTCHLQVVDSDGAVILDQNLPLASLWVPS